MTLESKERDWMTPKEVAAELEVTPRAVVNWIQQRKLNCTKVGGRYLYLLGKFSDRVPALLLLAHKVCVSIPIQARQ